MGYPGSELAERRKFFGAHQLSVDFAQVSPRHMEFVADSFRLLDQKGQAHRFFGKAIDDGSCLGPAGGISACAAVEFILCRKVIRTGEDVADLFLAWFNKPPILGGEASEKRIVCLTLNGGSGPSWQP